VAFRSSRVEPFGETFLRRALEHLLVDDVPGVRAVYLETVDALRRRELPTIKVAARVRLTKSPERYEATREQRRELPYEAMLASGRPHWEVGDKVRVYRTRNGQAAVAPEVDDEGATEIGDPRDYDVAHYERLLRDTFAARLQRAFMPNDYAVVFADPDQPSLFAPPLESIHPVLTPRPTPAVAGPTTNE
jgi:hypothetical protein